MGEGTAIPVNILVRGARQHNLKNIDVDIPKNKLVVITGLSGSGKSTLAFDTVYAEGQRRYVESLSAYARQFLELMEKPDVDSIDFLSPAISIEQKSISRNPRSTVGTITEIYDYMRLLYARVGDVFCPECGKQIEAYTVQKIVDRILAMKGARIEILSPIIRGKKGEYKKLLKELLKEGFVRAYINGEMFRLEEELNLDKNQKHSISIVIDRILVEEDAARRLTDSVEIALRRSGGLAEIKEGEQITLFSEHFACTDCNISMAEIEPRTFSFNNPFGACPACDGLGEQLVFDEAAIIPDPGKSVRQGCIAPWIKSDSFYYHNTLTALSAAYNVSITAPWKDLSDRERDILLNGTPEPLELYTLNGSKKVYYKKAFTGVMGYLKLLLSSGNQSDYEEASSYMRHSECPLCHGARLKRDSLFVRVGGKNIYEVSKLNILRSLEFFKSLEFTGFKREVAQKIIKEIIRRLEFMISVGIDYLTLNRPSATISGGEAQRIRLATQIGSSLTGVLYVLDEPSIGLHQRDNEKLLNTLKNLRDMGNSVIVVEHDAETILAAEHVIDMGPGAGSHGGELVFSGAPQELLQAENSLTGAYLSGKMKIEVPQKRRKTGGNSIFIKGARKNNLKNIDVEIPLSTVVCITGVSGSGKSTLALDILYPALMNRIYRSRVRNSGDYDEISGMEFIDKVIDVDQAPIGRTPRSNPATYTGLFSDIRTLFTSTPEAKMRGYQAGRFSFNVKGGRCETCKGEGYIKIEMHFLPDMYVKCDVCGGSRYNRDTLDIHFKGKSIADVLDLTVEDALQFFENVPAIKRKLELLNDVGLNYIKLGQPATTLSGGEAQRVKLAKELMLKQTGKTLYLFDEPTTGLHFDDVKKLTAIFDRLADLGNTVVIIEHNMDVIKRADYIIDLGPEGGDGGGEVIACGTPEAIAKNRISHTGKFLKRALKYYA
ncbi:MAG: excinuclease ABC subunit UvrA [Deferribacteraceae bacterium]|jgi:excinuclease ABC subunit A|nr:excinuclease ABC subunit UvrA [Deferribacteraceae bacterium]